MTTFDEHRNLALGTVSAGSTVIDSATGDTIVAGSDAEAAEFPAVPFYATLWRDQTPTRPAVEIVRATAFDGVRTFTVLRAQQGTAAQAFVTQGWKFANTITAADVVAIEDAVTGGEAGLAAETAARESADTALQGDISAEATARAAGDAATLSGAEAYADGKVSAEASARASADATLQTHIDSEATARASGDVATLSSSEGYTDGKVAAEAGLRVSGDAATLASAETYADAGDTTGRAYTDAEVATEAALRIAGDAATLGSAESYALVYVTSALGSAVSVGEETAVAGPRTVTAVTATKIEFPIFVAPGPGIATGLKITSSSGLASDPTNYMIVMLRRRRMSLPVNTYANEVLLDNPFAYWRFNENVGAAAALDSGSGNHSLTYSSPSPTLQQASLARRAANASALFVKASSTDAVASAYAWDFSGQQFTIECFIRMNSFGTPTVRQTVFGRPVTAGQPNIEIGGSNTVNPLQGKVSALQPGNFLYETVPFTILPGADEVHHIAYRKNGVGAGSQAIFVDGVKQTDAVEIATTNFTNASAETHVGSREHSGGSPAGQFLDAGADEVSVCMSALSDNRIQRHAAVGAPMAEISRKWTVLSQAFSEPITAWQPWTFDMCPFDPWASVFDKDDVITVAFYCQGSPNSLADVVCELTYELL